MMNMRQTSVDCYNEIVTNGLLSKRRLEVYEIIYSNGPLTANEIVRISKVKYPNTNPSSFNARLSELKRCGVIIEVGEKRDDISNNNCYIWDLTDRLPVKMKQPTNIKNDKINNIITALCELYKIRHTSTEEDWKSVARLISDI